jgi:hypothetical protein
MWTVLRPQIGTVTRTTCPFHERHPTANFPGCTCSIGYSSRDKSDFEMTEEERRRYYAALRGEHPDGSPLFT